MSKDLNQCNFIGRIGKDIELKFMANGNAVANFSIACGDDYKKDGQKVEQTNWINIVMFGKTAEILAEYCGKGSRIYVSGKQATRKWQTSEGQDRYTTEINARDFQMLDAKPQTTGAKPQSIGVKESPGSNSSQGPVDGFDDFDDSIPF